MKRLCSACLFLILISTMALGASTPVPFINQPLVPASVAPGSNGFTLTINGTGFASDAVVNWNGSPRATSVISSSTVQAAISAADVAKAGTASVTVTNPAKANRTSNVVYFPIRNKAAKVAFSIDSHLNASGAIAVGDFNNDGKLDVAVGTNDAINVYLGKGDGTFQKPIQNSIDFAPNFMVAADVNNDGKLDLLASNSLAGDGGVYVTALLGDGTGHLTQGNTYFGENDSGGPLAVGDLNGDGNLDFVISGQSTGGGITRVFLGNGDGTFQLKTGNQADGIGGPVLGDFNGDGKLDLAVPVGFESSTVLVCLGNGDGTFQSCTSYDSKLIATAVTAADVNGDGKLDLITDGVVVLLNNGDGTFSLGPTQQVSMLGGNMNPVAIGDFNGDGVLDVAVMDVFSSYSLQNVAVLLGRGNGVFRNPIEFAAGSVEFFAGLAVGDFNGTGDLGVVAAGSQTLLLLQSVTSMSPTSLSFGNQNVGTKSTPQIVTLRNIGSSSLPIEKIGITGANPKDFAQTNNCPSSLPAGHSCRFKVIFKPTQQGPRSASLSVSYKGAGSPQTVPLSGTGVSVTVTLTPSKLLYATQLINTVSSPQTATLTNTSNQVVSISNISTSGPFQQTNNCPSTLQAGANCQIQVEFDPQAKGPATGKLSVTDDAMGSPQTVALSGTGTVVELLPVGVNFGDQKVGTKSAPIPITLTNKGKTSLSISQIAIIGKDAADFAETNNCGSSVPPQGQCKISVTFTPKAKGGRSAVLKVSDDGGGSPQSVSLAGTGT
jgi:hypothetical protein